MPSILIVDDHPSFRSTARVLLQAEGFDVIIAPEDDRLRFTVRDEGLGIPAGEQERIFEKFYRLDAAMSRGVGGSGLGLYICRELVRRVDGRIWVEPRRGGGSTFVLEVPLADPHLRPARPRRRRRKSPARR